MGDIFDFESKNFKKKLLYKFYTGDFSNKKYGKSNIFKNFVFYFFS